MAAFAGWAPQQKGIVLDGFAGPGGWSEGIRRYLGLHDVGLEWDEAACDTRRAARHLPTIRVDVSCFVLGPLVGRVWGLLMSPPCTKFSAAGKGLGNRVMKLLADGIQRVMRGDDCRQELRDRIYPVALAEQEKSNADRPEGKRWPVERVEASARQDAFLTVLVLEPARYLHALLTGDTADGVPLEWAAFEQVPSVLPLWQVYALELRRFGWSVWTGILNAADYGVPQTRQRAVLIASAVRKVKAPTATHGKETESDGLFDDPREPWVTMADALGWGATDQPVPTVTAGGGSTGGAEPFPTRARQSLLDAQERGAWVLHTNRNQQPDGSRQTTDPHTAPAPALTSKSGGQWILKRPATTVCATNRISPPGHRDRSPSGESQFASPDTVRITVPEASVLQSFPVDYPWQGTKTKQYEQAGNAVPCLLAAHAVSMATGIPVTPQRLAAAA
jgi:DNA (cytosine-5)-methyltransferase 1